MSPPPTASPESARAATPEQWFTREVQPHGEQLKSYLRGTYPSVRDVDDVVQESYLRIWQAAATQTIQSGKAYLFQIARHVALGLIRREKVAPIDRTRDFLEVPAYDSKPNGAEVACTREEIALLADAIDSLPPRCREVFILRKLQRVEQKEIARRLGISCLTVQTLVQRGMRRCEKYFAQRGL